MFEFKLQIGCLLVALYIIAIYIKGTHDRKVRCNGVFDGLMYVAPWAIIFDGITAWTVNNQDKVPANINTLLHGLFFITMAFVVLFVFLYMIYQLFGYHGKKWILIESIPMAGTIIAVILTMNKLYYIEGNLTNYSMGVPVYICFASLTVHFVTVFLLVIIRLKYFEKRKVIGIISYIFVIMTVMLIQILMPEVLITSLIPTCSLASLYMNFEDPAFLRLQQYNSDMVTGFATLVENKDDNTGGHIRRTKEYVRIIINQMKKKNRFKRILTKDYIANVIDAAPMHDIGKIGTPDVILQKPGKLTAEEYEIMKQHSARGGEIIKKTFSDLEPEYQKVAYEIARFHHEKWNGRGYPEGLKEREIPLHARIMAIADVFDAVSAKRCYRDAMPIETCFKIIEEGIGTDFDPILAKLFLDAKPEILAFIKADS